jgi:hypothetical protein
MIIQHLLLKNLFPKNGINEPDIVVDILKVLNLDTIDKDGEIYASVSFY